MTGDRRRWWMLSLGMAAQTASCVFLYGLPYLLPDLRRNLGLSFTDASTLIGCPVMGVVLTLILWGAAADRYGERIVIAVGLSLAAVVLFTTAYVDGLFLNGLMLVLAGAGGASVNAASGRLVLGWFGPRERGFAMGARQTAQPLGTMLAALMLPGIAAGASVDSAFVVCGVLCLATALAVALFAVDPPRPERGSGERAGNPYRVSTLWRIHGASTLLVVPQFVVTGFALEFLVSEHGWSQQGAGWVLAVGNLLGASTRLIAGFWSDRVGSRLRPMRQLAVAIAVVVALVAIGMATRSALGVIALLAAAALSVSTNGLAFTAVAEFAGMSWAGRALGVQNTAQNIVASITPILTSMLIGATSYAAAFGVVALFPLLAAFAVPGDARYDSTRNDRSSQGAHDGETTHSLRLPAQGAVVQPDK
jgi:sugar phosphate permease